MAYIEPVDTSRSDSILGGLLWIVEIPTRIGGSNLGRQFFVVVAPDRADAETAALAEAKTVSARRHRGEVEIDPHVVKVELKTTLGGYF